MHTPLQTAVLFFLIEDNAVLFSEVATGKRNAGRTLRALEKTGSVSFAAALSSHCSSSSSRVPGQLMTSEFRVTRSVQVL